MTQGLTDAIAAVMDAIALGYGSGIAFVVVIIAIKRKQ